MAPKFGLLFFRRDHREMVGAMRLMEELGYDLLGLGDSQALAVDVYVGLTLAAVNTSRMAIGPCVTNPVTRHPAVTATAITSIDEVSGGRAHLGLGTGYSAVHNAGERPATFGSLTRSVRQIRELMEGKRVPHGGRSMASTRSGRAIPIYLAASGPRGLYMAGQVADGPEPTGTFPVSALRAGIEADPRQKHALRPTRTCFKTASTRSVGSEGWIPIHLEKR